MSENHPVDNWAEYESFWAEESARFRRREVKHYRCVLREHKLNPTFVFPFEAFDLFRAGVSGPEIYERFRPARLFPPAPADRDRLRAEARSRALNEQGRLQDMERTLQILRSCRENPALARGLNIDLDANVGEYMRRWFGGRKMMHPIPNAAGNVEWREDRRRHVELPAETKRYLFEFFEEHLWPYLFKIPRPCDRKLTPRELEAYKIVRQILTGSYRKGYAGGRGRRKGQLSSQPLSIWKGLPEQILRRLAHAGLFRAKKELAKPYWQGRVKGRSLFDPEGEEFREDPYLQAADFWGKSPAGIRRLRDVPRSDLLEAIQAAVRSATPELRAYIGGTREFSEKRAKQLKQQLIRRVERRLKA